MRFEQPPKGIRLISCLSKSRNDISLNVLSEGDSARLNPTQRRILSVLTRYSQPDSNNTSEALANDADPLMERKETQMFANTAIIGP